MLPAHYNALDLCHTSQKKLFLDPEEDVEQEADDEEEEEETEGRRADKYRGHSMKHDPYSLNEFTAKSRSRRSINCDTSRMNKGRLDSITL